MKTKKTLEQHIVSRSEKENKSIVNKHVKILEKENKELKKIVDIFNTSLEYTPSLIRKEIKDKKPNTEATAVVLASDWHLEQRVDPRRLTYFNEYNINIAEDRSKQFFINVVKLLNKEQKTTKIENLILWLGGDFISGNIHDALTAICAFGPAQAIIFAQELLIGGIQFLLDNTDVKITCPTSCGNHSRITKKVWISTEEDNSLETIIYHNIKQYFKGNPRFELLMPSGPITILNVYDKKIAFAHGHHGVKFMGGVGGIDVPLRKYILKKFSKLPMFYMICIGHFHQYKQDSSFAVNGSMIGYDDYSESMGFEFDVPRQTFFLIDKKRDSRTVTVPIMFDP